VILSCDGYATAHAASCWLAHSAKMAFKAACRFASPKRSSGMATHAIFISYEKTHSSVSSCMMPRATQADLESIKIDRYLAFLKVDDVSDVVAWRESVRLPGRRKLMSLLLVGKRQICDSSIQMVRHSLDLEWKQAISMKTYVNICHLTKSTAVKPSLSLSKVALSNKTLTFSFEDMAIALPTPVKVRGGMRLVYSDLIADRQLGMQVRVLDELTRKSIQALRRSRGHSERPS
jgi:hypothetical protein